MVWVYVIISFIVGANVGAMTMALFAAHRS